jgi:hypothetical protein
VFLTNGGDAGNKKLKSTQKKHAFNFLLKFTILILRKNKTIWQIKAAFATLDAGFKMLEQLLQSIGGLVISRADCRALAARRRTTAHFTIVSTVLCTGYGVNKTVSCVLRNVILVTMI